MPPVPPSWPGESGLVIRRASTSPALGAVRIHRLELGEFLRARRLAAEPDLASASDRRRRVSGVRHADVASLADVSVEHYAPPRTGSPVGAFEPVLLAIARALRPNEAERRHLLTLCSARQSWRSRRTEPAEGAHPGLLRLMDALADTPVLVHGLGLDVLAANDAARAVIADFSTLPTPEHNMVRWFLLDPDSGRFVDWEAVAAELVGLLRVDLGAVRTTTGSAHWWKNRRNSAPCSDVCGRRIASLFSL